MSPSHVIGIDVGTGSARAGVFDLQGRMVGLGVKAIQTWHPQPDFVEQSSADIWKAVCTAVKTALKQAGISGSEIAGIAFDAACSLVVVDERDRPVTVSPTGRDEQNIIVWMDHRAIIQARKLTEQGHEVISYLGGKVSPEHAIPKVMWMKQNLPDTWQRAHRFYDLPDWLTYRATGRDVRSLCTTVCKWTYLGHEKEGQRWNKEFFRKNRLGDVVKRGAFGEVIEPMGDCAGGLNYQSAHELGLEVGTPVAVGIIDAHAGGLGVLGMGKKPSAGATSSGNIYNDVLCLIGGTSTCHMVVSQKPRFVPGVWGPYYSAMIPGMWLNEGGQSATGALMDFVITSHKAYPDALKDAKKESITIYEFLNRQVDRLVADRGLKRRCELTREYHVLPYFHGNRSPNADASARGAIHGLQLHAALDDLALQYYAIVQAIAYGTRDIIEALNAKGYAITRMHACGGGTKNPLWMQEHADATGCEIILPREPEAVILGSAILAAVGSGIHKDIPTAMQAMSAPGATIKPDKRSAPYHAAKMQIHRALYADQKKYDAMVAKTGVSGKK